jgi:hypothetical protein
LNGASRDVVQSFTAGAGGDIINIEDATAGIKGVALTGTAALQSWTTGVLTIADQVVAISGVGHALADNLLTGATASDLNGTNLIAITGAITTGANKNANVLLAVADSAGHIGVYFGNTGAGDANLTASEMTLIAVLTLTGVQTITDLVFANFGNANLV